MKTSKFAPSFLDTLALLTLMPSAPRFHRLRHALMTWGEKFTKQECDVLLQEAPVDSRGRIDIRRFASLVTRGADEDDQQDG